MRRLQEASIVGVGFFGGLQWPSTPNQRCVVVVRYDGRRDALLRLDWEMNMGICGVTSMNECHDTRHGHCGELSLIHTLNSITRTRNIPAG